MDRVDGAASDFYRVPAFAKRMGLGRSTAYNGVRNGEIPAIRVCGTWLIHKSVMEKMVAEATRVPADGVRTRTWDQDRA